MVIVNCENTSANNLGNFPYLPPFHLFAYLPHSSLVASLLRVRDNIDPTVHMNDNVVVIVINLHAFHRLNHHQQKKEKRRRCDTSALAF